MWSGNQQSAPYSCKLMTQRPQCLVEAARGQGHCVGGPASPLHAVNSPSEFLLRRVQIPEGLLGWGFLLLPKIEEACKVKSRKEGGRGVYLTQLELLRRTFGHSSDCKHLILACPTPEGGGLLTLSLHPQGPPASFWLAPKATELYWRPMAPPGGQHRELCDVLATTVAFSPHFRSCYCPRPILCLFSLSSQVYYTHALTISYMCSSRDMHTPL